MNGSSPDLIAPPAASTIVITIDSRPPDALARASGEIDMLTAPRLDEELDRLLTSGCLRVELDLSDVSFLAAAGLAVLARADRRFQEASGRLLLIRPTPTSRRLFALTGLDAELTIC